MCSGTWGENKYFFRRICHVKTNAAIYRYSGSGYCLSTGSLFPSDELIGNYEKLQENNHNAVDRSCVRSPIFSKSMENMSILT